VTLLALRRYDELGELDGDAGFDAVAWRDALAPYWDEHDEIRTGPDARGPGLLLIDTSASSRADQRSPAAVPRLWRVRQIIDDPAGDHGWGITAEIDLDESDATGAAAVTIVEVGEL
jgi:hypothetical protein